MSGPLAPLFAQVRTVVPSVEEIERRITQAQAVLDDPDEYPREYVGDARREIARCERLRTVDAALSSIERHVQDMEKALRPFVEEYDFRAADYLAQRVDGEEARVFTARTVDLLIEHQRAARAALPARMWLKDHAPELAALVLDMGEELRAMRNHRDIDWNEVDSLLARLDQLGKEQTREKEEE